MKKNCYNCARYYEVQYHEKCNICVTRKGDCTPSEWIPGPIEVSPVTNYELIKQLSVEELAVFLAKHIVRSCCLSNCSECLSCDSCDIEKLKDWLESEVEE